MAIIWIISRQISQLLCTFRRASESSERFWKSLKQVSFKKEIGVKIQNGTQQQLIKLIDFVKFEGQKMYMLKMGGSEMGPNKIWIKW